MLVLVRSLVVYVSGIMKGNKTLKHTAIMLVYLCVDQRVQEDKLLIASAGLA